MKIYLDTNIWCRPFDDLSDKKISEEIKAITAIFSISKNHFFEICSSEAVIAEISLIEELSKKEEVERLIYTNCKSLFSLTPHLIGIVDNFIKKISLTYFDALHLVLAASGECSYFITCDNEINRKRENIENKIKDFSTRNMKVRNPIDFIQEVGL